MSMLGDSSLDEVVELTAFCRRTAEVLTGRGHDPDAVTAALLSAAIHRSIEKSGAFAVAHDLTLMAALLKCRPGQSTAATAAH